jgi:hypothetical protein
MQSNVIQPALGNTFYNLYKCPPLPRQSLTSSLNPSPPQTLLLIQTQKRYHVLAPKLSPLLNLELI